MVEDKPFTLDDYAKQVLAPMYERIAQDEIKYHEEYERQLKFWGYKPPTRYQRFKAYWKDKAQRCKDIWTIISGGDIHDNCGY